MVSDNLGSSSGYFNGDEKKDYFYDDDYEE